MFRGTFFHILDEKGRVAIPRKFREPLGSHSETRVVVTRSVGSDPRTLDVYPMAEWQILEERIRAMPQFQERTRRFKRLYLHPAQDLVLDAQGRILIPQDLRGRNMALQWLFWQMGGLGPMAGQNHHFSQYAPEQIPYAIERYVKETGRLYAVLNKHLADGREFIAGDYSIADMACYPWIVPHERQRQRLEDFEHLERWFTRIKDRPATGRAYARASEVNKSPVVDDAAKKVLFGQDASSVR